MTGSKRNRSVDLEDGAMSASAGAFGDQRRKRKGSIDLNEFVERHVSKIDSAVGTLARSTIAKNTSASGSRNNPAIDAWKENNEMFKIVESALQGLERAKRKKRAECEQIAELRYQKVLGDYRRICGSNELGLLLILYILVSLMLVCSGFLFPVGAVVFKTLT